MTQVKPRPAQAKPAPRFEDFSVHSILTSEESPTRVNSERCLEAAGYPAAADTIMGNARHIPRPLLELEAKRLEAAVVNQADISGLVSTMLGPAVLPTLDQGDIMDRLNVTRPGRPVISYPSVSGLVSTGTPTEAAPSVAADPNALEIGQINSAHRRLQSTVMFTQESEAAAGSQLFSAVLAATVLAQLDNLAETMVWAGTGLSGQPTGIETQLTDALSVSYVVGGLTLPTVWRAIAAMNVQKLPRAGRFWVASPDMSATLSAGYGLSNQRGQEAMLHGLPVVHSTRPVEDAGNGRLWLVSGRSIQPVFFGAVEMVLHTPPMESSRKASWLAQWDLINRHSSPFRCVRVL